MIDDQSQRQSNKERRQFIRVPFQKNITYSICYNKFTPHSVEGNSKNISGGGILFKTKWPPPIMSVLSINLDVYKLKDYVNKENLQDKLDVNKLYMQNGKLYGEVVRIKEYPESGYYDVALQLIQKKDS
ncbi:MAG: PilZ domain-containing protein [Candidatus Omnitrophica bacterium]|nr:PilZ domain-containing protein [Candidatus Omnitrophota bacterium]